MSGWMNGHYSNFRKLLIRCKLYLKVSSKPLNAPICNSRTLNCHPEPRTRGAAPARASPADAAPAASAAPTAAAAAAGGVPAAVAHVPAAADVRGKRGGRGRAS